MNISSVLLLESLCCVVLGAQMVTWVNILCGNSVASVFQTARIFVVCLISKIICLLSVNPGLVWIPSYMLSIFFVFCKSSGLQLLITRKISLYNIFYAQEDFVKI